MNLLLPLALALALAAPHSGAAERVGRLFFTPGERAQLDAARSKRVRTGANTEKADEAPPPPMPEIVTYGGMVRRSDGKTTVWLNNRAVTGKDSPGAKMLNKVRPDGTVTLQSPQTGRNVNLQVGQRADLLSGQIEEGYRRTTPRPEEKPDSVGSRPVLESGAAGEGERGKEERERQENLDDAVRAMRDAAQARPAAPAPQPAPPTAQTTSQGIVVVPAPSPAPATVPAQSYR